MQAELKADNLFVQHFAKEQHDTECLRRQRYTDDPQYKQDLISNVWSDASPYLMLIFRRLFTPFRRFALPL